MTPRSSPFLVYGAYGLTGSLIVREALRRGHRPILAGRDARKLERQATEHGLSFRAFELGDAARVDDALQGVRAVVVAAGPFAQTSAPFRDACLRTRTHYLDTNGELETFQDLFAHDERAKAQGVCLVSGAGFGVTVGDCVAAHVAHRLPGATAITLALAPDNAYRTRAVSASMMQVIADGGLCIRKGALVRERIAQRTQCFSRRGVSTPFASAPMAELVTTLRTTGIRNVTAYVPMAPMSAWMMRAFSPLVGQALRTRWIRDAVDRPWSGATSLPESTRCSWALAEASDDEGRAVRTVFTAGEGFHFAAEATVLALEKVLASDLQGVFTPAQAFGKDHLLELRDVERTDISI